MQSEKCTFCMCVFVCLSVCVYVCVCVYVRSVIHPLSPSLYISQHSILNIPLQKVELAASTSKVHCVVPLYLVHHFMCNLAMWPLNVCECVCVWSEF